MPVTYTTTLAPKFSTSTFAKSFRWLDDSNEDAGFVAFVRGQLDYEDTLNPSVNERVRNLAVDRAGAPTLIWETWEPEWDEQAQDYVWAQVGTGMRTIGASGTIWRQASWLFSSSLGYLGQFPMTGFFECDEFGRAYKLSDLLAPPKIAELTGSVSSSRVLTLQWQPDDAFTAYEVHEFLKTPESTLKATVTTPSRVSSVLAPNQTLEYAVRGKTVAGELGPFSDRVVVVITANGGTVTPKG